MPSLPPPLPSSSTSSSSFLSSSSYSSELANPTRSTALRKAHSTRVRPLESESEVKGAWEESDRCWSSSTPLRTLSPRTTQRVVKAIAFASFLDRPFLQREEDEFFSSTGRERRIASNVADEWALGVSYIARRRILVRLYSCSSTMSSCRQCHQGSVSFSKNDKFLADKVLAINKAHYAFMLIQSTVLIKNDAHTHWAHKTFRKNHANKRKKGIYLK